MSLAGTSRLVAPVCLQGWTEDLQTTVLTWFAEHGRYFPWRSSHNPFHVLVAEVLLRQTQAQRVVQPYLALTNRYPDPSALASADVESLRDWFKPLGLVKRADRLLQTARIIVGKHRGKVPRDLATLEALPGLGQYSARAILCLAFGDSAPMIDGSSGRLLRRTIGLRREGPAYSDCGLREEVTKVLPAGACRCFNLGLLDIAAHFCHSSSPECSECVLAHLCACVQSGTGVSRGGQW